MQLIKESTIIQVKCEEYLNRDLTIGFVPTMGALHAGHLKLIEKSIEQNDITVVSIFVNPTQFNNPIDLERYPRKLIEDLNMLKELQVDVVFSPDYEEIKHLYSKSTVINLGSLGLQMEALHRPGHFEGVMQVVELLFALVHPTRAYFGKKDFQQVAVIQHMVRELNLTVQIIPCEIEREASGLALSSRNQLLSPEEKKEASKIYGILRRAKVKSSEKSPKETAQWIEDAFLETKLILEYVSIVNPHTLMALNGQWMSGATVCVVAHAGNVRLLDNLELRP